MTRPLLILLLICSCCLAQANDFSVQVKSYFRANGFGTITHQSDLLIYRDSQSKVYQLSFQMKDWIDDLFIFNGASGDFLGQELNLTPTPFPQFSDWKITCERTRPVDYCEESFYLAAREKHFDPKNWKRSVTDVSQGRVPGDWLVKLLTVFGNTQQENFQVIERRSRGGFQIYETDWKKLDRAQTVVDGTNEYALPDRSMQVRLVYKYNNLSQILQVFVGLYNDEGELFEDPMGPIVFCHGCSSGR